MIINVIQPINDELIVIECDEDGLFEANVFRGKLFVYLMNTVTSVEYVDLQSMNEWVTYIQS